MVKLNNSKQGRVLDHLLKGNVITQRMAIELFNSYRLGAIIFRLREDGHDVETKLITRNKITFALYYLKNEYAL
jgi:hypothetical protein